MNHQDQFKRRFKSSLMDDLGLKLLHYGPGRALGYGRACGFGRWMPHWLQQCIVKIWNRTNCFLFGHSPLNIPESIDKEDGSTWPAIQTPCVHCGVNQLRGT